MKLSIGDKILFKKETLKGKVLRINSAYNVTVLSEDGFEINVSVKDLVKVEYGTDKPISYGDKFYSKDHLSTVKKSPPQQKSQIFLKVDLHIELLTPNYHYMNNFEIVQLQLNECYEKIERAINSNINRIEIVHGIGEGVLRREVHNILRGYKLRFYLKKDGGSTEVYL